MCATPHDGRHSPILSQIPKTHATELQVSAPKLPSQLSQPRPSPREVVIEVALPSHCHSEGCEMCLSDRTVKLAIVDQLSDHGSNLLSGTTNLLHDHIQMQA